MLAGVGAKGADYIRESILTQPPKSLKATRTG